MKVIAACAAIALGACYSAGVQVRPEQLQAFKKGETSYADVVQQFGPPTTNMVKSDGTRSAIYSYTHAQARPATFIPIVGAFAGGADATHTLVVFHFDRAGKLAEYTSSDTNVGSGTNLAAGAPQSMPSSSQPIAAPSAPGESQ